MRVFNKRVVSTEMPLSGAGALRIALSLSHLGGKLRKVSFSQLGERGRIYELEKCIPDAE